MYFCVCLTSGSVAYGDVVRGDNLATRTPLDTTLSAPASLASPLCPPESTANVLDDLNEPARMLPPRCAQLLSRILKAFKENPRRAYAEGVCKLRAQQYQQSCVGLLQMKRGRASALDIAPACAFNICEHRPVISCHATAMTVVP